MNKCTPLAMLALLAACSSTPMNNDTSSDTSSSMGSSSTGNSGTGSTSSGSTSSGSTSSSTGNSNSSMGTSGTSGVTGSTSPVNATITNIDTVPRVGATAGERSYKITVRGDDGTTRTLSQDEAPWFKNGDRVNYSNGMIQQQR